jgi:hypothetical protein
MVPLVSPRLRDSWLPVSFPPVVVVVVAVRTFLRLCYEVSVHTHRIGSNGSEKLTCSSISMSYETQACSENRSKGRRQTPSSLRDIRVSKVTEADLQRPRKMS